MKKTPLYTADEYRALACEINGDAEWAARIRILISWAYPIKHPLYQLACETHENITFFKINLESLACIEHRCAEMIAAFDPANYEHPTIIPGCTSEETELLTTAISNRINWIEKVKSQPLSPDELRAVCKFICHIANACNEIIKKADAAKPTDPALNKAINLLLKPSSDIWTACNLCTLLAKEQEAAANANH